MQKFEFLKIFLILIVSTLISFVIVEFTYRYIKSFKNEGELNFKVMLFQQGKNFKNVENFFFYEPNINLRTAAFYMKRHPKSINDIKLEYDYLIKTNNLGLVMQQDISIGDRVIFIIGSSFTEGQGVTPWFYEYEKKIKGKIKVVNLGLIGTSPMQWLKMVNYLKKKYALKVEGIIFNIILPSLDRSYRNFGEIEMNCLKTGDCPYRGSHQGFDFIKISKIGKIKKSILDKSNLPIPKTSFNIKIDNQLNIYSIRSIAKQSHVIRDIYDLYIHQLRFKSTNLSQNITSLEDLINLSKSNVFINIINTKKYSKNPDKQKKTGYAKVLLKFISAKKVPMNWCLIPPENFFKNDGHPNKLGYDIISNCTLIATYKVLDNV